MTENTETKKNDNNDPTFVDELAKTAALAAVSMAASLTAMVVVGNVLNKVQERKAKKIAKNETES